MEEKLEQYRLRKRRKQNWESFKDRVKKFIMPEPVETTINIENSNTDDGRVAQLTPVYESTLNESEVLIAHDDEENVAAVDNQENKVFKYTLRTVFFLFWVTLYIIAIELKFGIVYLMMSSLIGIYLNTRTGPKKPGEISAYSVFNENCEAIDGTLKAEQFEKELFYGSSIGK